MYVCTYVRFQPSRVWVSRGRKDDLEAVNHEGSLLQEMMSVDTVNERVRAFLVEHFPLVRKRGLNDDESLFQNGLVDSLGVVEVVTFLEREFQITVTDEDLLPENFESIECIGDFVQGKLRNSVASQSKG